MNVLTLLDEHRSSSATLRHLTVSRIFGRLVAGRLPDGADVLVFVLVDPRGRLLFISCRSSLSAPSRENTWTSMTTPSTPGGTRRGVANVASLLAEDGARSFSSGRAASHPSA